MRGAGNSLFTVAHWMTLLALLAAPWVARAENPLSFSYLELAGTPVLNNTRTTPVLDGETELEGSGGDLVFSLAVHKNWFFMLQWDSSRQESDNYLGLANLGIQNDLKIKQELPALLERDHHERLGATGHDGLGLRGKRSGSEVVALGEHNNVTKLGRNQLAEALAVLVSAPQDGHGCRSIVGDHVGERRPLQVVRRCGPAVERVVVG